MPQRKMMSQSNINFGTVNSTGLVSERKVCFWNSVAISSHCSSYPNSLTLARGHNFTGQKRTATVGFKPYNSYRAMVTLTYRQSKTFLSLILIRFLIQHALITNYICGNKFLEGFKETIRIVHFYWYLNLDPKPLCIGRQDIVLAGLPMGFNGIF